MVVRQGLKIFWKTYILKYRLSYKFMLCRRKHEGHGKLTGDAIESPSIKLLLIFC